MIVERSADRKVAWSSEVPSSSRGVLARGVLERRAARVAEVDDERVKHSGGGGGSVGTDSEYRQCEPSGDAAA